VEKPCFDNSGHAEPEDPRQALELEISRVEAQIDQLMQKRKSLMKALNDRFSPVLQLPCEVSTEIFMHYVRVPNEFTTPFQLGHICKAWRDFVWSTPKLWSTVSIVISHLPLCELLEEWLAHSGLQPLTIDLKFGWYRNEYDSDEEAEVQFDQFKNVMDVLTRVSDRWHVVNFRLPFRDANYESIMRNALQKPLPILTSVSFKDLEILEDILSSAPQLDEIQLSSCKLDSYAFLSRNVARISLSHTSLTEYLKILANIPSLNHCTITAISPIGHKALPVVNTTALVANCLESLTICETYHLPASNLLDRITAPSLRELVINARPSSFPLPNIISFITRSSCTLQRLSLSCIGIQGSSLFECLQLTPSLVELNLSSASLRNEYITLISPYPISGARFAGCLLPQLQLLTYEGHLDINSLELNIMLLARWQQNVEGKVALLKRVHLRLKGDLKTFALPQHPQRVAEGMYLFIVTADSS
jgi:hypothetical protein